MKSLAALSHLAVLKVAKVGGQFCSFGAKIGKFKRAGFKRGFRYEATGHQEAGLFFETVRRLLAKVRSAEVQKWSTAAGLLESSSQVGSSGQARRELASSFWFRVGHTTTKTRGFLLVRSVTCM
jgi:hypothetical protein